MYVQLVLPLAEAGLIPVLPISEQDSSCTCWKEYVELVATAREVYGPLGRKKRANQSWYYCVKKLMSECPVDVQARHEPCTVAAFVQAMADAGLATAKFEAPQRVSPGADAKDMVYGAGVAVVL